MKTDTSAVNIDRDIGDFHYKVDYGYDAGVYYSAADALIHGRTPYRDFLLLHPPGLMLTLTPFAAIGRLSARPVRVFTIVASVALVVSWAAPLGAYSANAFPGTTASRIAGVMALHAIAGVITIVLLRTYGTAAGHNALR